MTDGQKIEIGLNKKKLKNGLITCASLGILGVMLFSSTNNDWIKYGVSVISILFFGFGVFYFLRKLTDKKPGILIDDNGILDNSSAVSVGLIRWDDVKQFTRTTSMKQEFLVVQVINPEYYINKQTNFIMKIGMKYNLKHFGSPLAISANLLNSNLNELTTMLEKRLTSRHE